MTQKTWTRDSNFKWCIDNDFQVYVCPKGFLEEKKKVTKEFKVCVRRGGIKTGGLDSIEIDSVYYESKESVGNETYKTQKDAEAALPALYEDIRKIYG
jgi:hypothetical protein